MRLSLLLLLCLAFFIPARQTPRVTETAYLLKPAHVFDGEQLHDNWVVLVRGEKIVQVGPAGSVDGGSGAVLFSGASAGK